MDKALLSRSNEIYNIETNELPVNQQQIKTLSKLNKQIKTLSEEGELEREFADLIGTD